MTASVIGATKGVFLTPNITPFFHKKMTFNLNWAKKMQSTPTQHSTNGCNGGYILGQWLRHRNGYLFE